MEEIWKDIKGYEGKYQVSNLGRVNSLHRGKERILKPRIDKDGYRFITLYNKRKEKTYRIHRLVATHFIPNNNLFKTEVNHKDEDKTNNRVDNLEWCDRQYNINYSLAKAVNQYSIDGEYVKKWESAKEINRELGFSQGRISDCCRGDRKTAYGYRWCYV